MVVRRWFGGGVCTSKRKMQGKTVLVTGGNGGIGLETARDMARRGARVLIACRNISAGNDAAADIRKTTGNGNVEVYHLNLANLGSVRDCCSEIMEREERLDVLINNAGVMLAPHDAKTDDGYELQMGTNHIGHFLFTNLLLQKIKNSAPSRIVNVSSSAHMFASKKFLENDILSVDGISDWGMAGRDWGIYGRSKMANIMFTSELHKRLKGSGVTVYSLHPGAVRTGLQRHMSRLFGIFVWIQQKLGFWKTPVQGAQTNIYCAVQEGIEEHSGKYFSDCRVKKPRHPYTTDEDAWKKLWDFSDQIVSLD